MEPEYAIALFVIFAIGIAFGVMMGRNKDNSAEKVKVLEEKLAEADAENSRYRDEVADHFGKTAVLFNQMTEDYKAVYEHLAHSSNALCGDRVAKLSAEMPGRGLLEKEGEVTEEIVAESAQVAANEEASATDTTAAPDNLDKTSDAAAPAEGSADTEVKVAAESEQGNAPEEVVSSAHEAEKREEAARIIH